MLDQNNQQTLYLSPGAMIKTGVLISEIIGRHGSLQYDEATGIVEKKLQNTFNSILSFLLNLIMTIGLIAACVFCVIQYVICIF